MLTVGAPGSCLGSALPLTHEPLAIICVTEASSVNVSVQPLLNVTEDCTKLLSFICTVGQLLVELELPLLEELLDVLAVLVPERWQATSSTLPSTKATIEKTMKRVECDLILRITSLKPKCFCA